MVTVMLVVIPKGAGAAFAGRPLKNVTSGSFETTDGRSIPVDKDVFTALKVEDEIIVDKVTYRITKISTILPTMGKFVIEPVE